MRLLIATDAWHPQVNGVVRTLMSLARSLRRQGVAVEFLTPDGFPSMPVPTYPCLRVALPNPREIARAHRAAPRRMPFTSPRKARSGTWCGATASSADCRSRRAIRRAFPSTSGRASRSPSGWTYAALRRFHAAATVTMVSTRSLMTELGSRGFDNLGLWTRGVDTDLFQARARHRSRSAAAAFRQRGADRGREEPRSIPLARSAGHQDRHRTRASGGRAARPLPGREVPRATWKARRWRPISPRPTSSSSRARRTPSASFSSRPSLPACRLRPIPSRDPRTSSAASPIGVLSNDLREACLGALRLSREACRAFALENTWENSARQFLGHVSSVLMDAFDHPDLAYARGRSEAAAANAGARFAIGLHA